MPIRFDGSEAEEPSELISEGIYPVKILSAEEKTSSKGHGMILIRLGTMGEDHVCFDNIMCGGKGAGMGKGKLKAFGVDVDDGELLAAESLQGKRAYASIMHETYQGQTRAKVALDEESPYCGYWPWDEPPASVSSFRKKEAQPAGGKLPEEDLDDTPF